MPSTAFKVSFTLDGMDNKVNTAYSGWPDRLFVVGHDGKIAYSGARGPRGFDPKGWEAGIKKAVKAAPKPEPEEGEAGDAEQDDPKTGSKKSGDAKKE